MAQTTSINQNPSVKKNFHATDFFIVCAAALVVFGTILLFHGPGVIFSNKDNLNRINNGAEGLRSVIGGTSDSQYYNDDSSEDEYVDLSKFRLRIPIHENYAGIMQQVIEVPKPRIAIRYIHYPNGKLTLVIPRNGDEDTNSPELENVFRNFSTIHRLITFKLNRNSTGSYSPPESIERGIYEFHNSTLMAHQDDASTTFSPDQNMKMETTQSPSIRIRLLSRKPARFNQHRSGISKVSTISSRTTDLQEHTTHF